MAATKRTYAAALAAIAAVLGGIVVFDIYEDWRFQGEPLYLTLVENSIPLALVGVLIYATYWLYHNVHRDYLATVTKWTAIGVVGIVLLGAWVFGVQSLQTVVEDWGLETTYIDCPTAL